MCVKKLLDLHASSLVVNKSIVAAGELLPDDTISNDLFRMGSLSTAIYCE